MKTWRSWDYLTLVYRPLLCGLTNALVQEKGKKSATHFSEIIEWWGMKLDLSRYILRPVSGTKEAFHKYSLNEHKVHFPDFMLFIFCFKFCIYLFLAAQGL